MIICDREADDAVLDVCQCDPLPTPASSKEALQSFGASRLMLAAEYVVALSIAAAHIHVSILQSYIYHSKFA